MDKANQLSVTALGPPHTLERVFYCPDNNSGNHGLGECSQCGNVASPNVASSQLVIEIGYWQYRLFATFALVAAESLCLSATLR